MWNINDLPSAEELVELLHTRRDEGPEAFVRAFAEMTGIDPSEISGRSSEEMLALEEQIFSHPWRPKGNLRLYGFMGIGKGGCDRSSLVAIVFYESGVRTMEEPGLHAMVDDAAKIPGLRDGARERMKQAALRSLSALAEAKAAVTSGAKQLDDFLNWEAVLKKNSLNLQSTMWHGSNYKPDILKPT